MASVAQNHSAGLMPTPPADPKMPPQQPGFVPSRPFETFSGRNWPRIARIKLHPGDSILIPAKKNCNRLIPFSSVRKKAATGRSESRFARMKSQTPRTGHLTPQCSPARSSHATPRHRAPIAGIGISPPNRKSVATPSPSRYMTAMQPAHAASTPANRGAPLFPHPRYTTGRTWPVV